MDIVARCQQPNSRDLWLSRRLERGTASDFIHHAELLLRSRPGMKVVLYVRVSTRQQVANGNLDDAKHEALERLRELGVEPIAIFAGHESSDIRRYRPLLNAAIRCALQNGAIVVAPSRCRLLRWWGVGGDRGIRNELERPTTLELEELIDISFGVQFATLDHPDESARPSQVKRGQRAKGHKGGRPSKTKPGEKKARRMKLLPEAIELRRQDLSLREIAGILNVRHSTIQGWLSGVRFSAASQSQ